MVDVTRRRFLTGGKPSLNPIYPPWSGDETLFSTRCTTCHACVEACETAIVQPGSRGIPVIRFDAGECLFCYACAQACPESLFLAQTQSPWSLKSVIGQGCLAKQAVECRRCQDGCDVRAIVFQPSLKGIWQPVSVSDSCTGCGACVALCPTSVIHMEKVHVH